MSQTAALLTVYGALAVVLTVTGVAFWWYYRKQPTVRRCAMCGAEPAPWLYHHYRLCSDDRCLDQAEAEHQQTKENQ